MRLIGFTGKPESGKSTAARFLAKKYGLPHINVGDGMKAMLTGFYRLCGLSESEIVRRLFGDLKEGPDPYLNGKTPRYACKRSARNL
jgi:dephospho-CoA kinase